MNEPTENDVKRWRAEFEDLNGVTCDTSSVSFSFDRYHSEGDYCHFETNTSWNIYLKACLKRKEESEKRETEFNLDISKTAIYELELKMEIESLKKEISRVKTDNINWMALSNSHKNENQKLNQLVETLKTHASPEVSERDDIERDGVQWPDPPSIECSIFDYITSNGRISKKLVEKVVLPLLDKKDAQIKTLESKLDEFNKSYIDAYGSDEGVSREELALRLKVMHSWVKQHQYALNNSNSIKNREIAKAEAKSSKVIAILEFYGDRNNYDHVCMRADGEDDGAYIIIEDVGGKLARETLAEIKDTRDWNETE